ncbi:MAG: hypothetical protein JNL82_04075 [Myxococcales bacterium]|nr:hypothetical protein [Myxococcales bacterium]
MRLVVVVAVVRTVVVIAYPAAIWLGASRLEPRTLGLVLLALVVPNLAIQVARAPSARRWAVLRVPLTVAILVGVGAALAEPRFFLALPVLINLSLLAHFAGSLRGPVSIIEHFARVQEPDLPEGGPAYCRSVTVAWCWFFAVNAAVSATLAGFAPIAWWALYTGLVAYILVGLGFAVEYVVRRRRFRRFTDAWHDRVLARLLGP